MHITDEAFGGLLRLERRIRNSPKSIPWLERGLRWQESVIKQIGLDKFDCIECPLGRRSLDARLAQAIQLGGKVLRRGDLIEFKDFSSDRSVELGLQYGQLTRQLVDYARSAGEGNKLFLVFRRPISTRSIDHIETVLRANNIQQKVEIINGL